MQEIDVSNFLRIATVTKNVPVCHYSFGDNLVFPNFLYLTHNQFAPVISIINSSQVLKSIQPSIGPQRVNLLAADGKPESDGKVNFTIPVSEYFQNLLITVSANNSLVTVHPNDTNNKCENIYNQTICKIEVGSTRR